MWVSSSGGRGLGDRPLSVRGSFAHWVCLDNKELGIQILPSDSWRRVLGPLLELILSFAVWEKAGRSVLGIMRVGETNPPPLGVPFRNPHELPGPCVCAACPAAASIHTWKGAWETLGPEMGREERVMMTGPHAHWAPERDTALCIQVLGPLSQCPALPVTPNRVPVSP